MKGCLLFFGESFRLGKQFTRDIGSDSSYHDQILASKSHLKFIQDINFPIDVYLTSYTTKYSQELIQLYEGYLIRHKFHDSLVGQVELIRQMLSTIDLSRYNFILILRIDLFLKPHFTKIFQPSWNTIMWPSICFKPYHTTARGYPRVNDTMLFVPQKYFSYLPTIYASQDTHAQWEYLLEHSFLTVHDLDTMLPTFHDSDSNKDKNPIYRIVNREESTVHHNPGEIFYKHNRIGYILGVILALGVILQFMKKR